MHINIVSPQYLKDYHVYDDVLDEYIEYQLIQEINKHLIAHRSDLDIMRYKRNWFLLGKTEIFRPYISFHLFSSLSGDFMHINDHDIYDTEEKILAMERICMKIKCLCFDKNIWDVKYKVVNKTSILGIKRQQCDIYFSPMSDRSVGRFVIV